jgi:hypothetical protein
MEGAAVITAPEGKAWGFLRIRFVGRKPGFVGRKIKTTGGL